MNFRSRGEQAQDEGGFDGVPSFEGYSASLVVPLKVLLFLGVIKSWVHYTIFTTVTQVVMLFQKSWYYIGNMTETPKNFPTSDERYGAEPQADWDPSDDSPFIGEAGSVARRVVQEPAVVVDSEPRQPNKMSNRTRAGIAVGLVAAVAVGPQVVDRLNGPEFSEDSTTYTVEPGDGLQNVAEAVEGSNKVDIRDVEQHISVDPANIDVLKDGLQPGETIVIPTKVEE